MANTYTSLHYHIVFSTKLREPWITPDIEQRIWAFLGGITRKNRMKPLEIGGVDDHIRILLGAPATMAPAKASQLIKGGSSAWIHTEFPLLRNFAWQDGYGAFTVSKSHLQEVIAYIQNQRQHHCGKTFKEEFLSLLERHEIDYDEPSGRIALWGVPVSFNDSRGQLCFRQQKRNEFTSIAFWNLEEDAAAAA